MIHIPQVINRTCYRCGRSTPHQISQVRKGKQSSLSQIRRREARRGNRGNKGKFSKIPSKRIKTSKRPYLLLKCRPCGYRSNLCRPRCNKFEIRAV